MRERTFEDGSDDFAAHATLYVLVMTALIVLNFSFLTGFWWSAIPLVAWGIVLALHYCTCGRTGTPTAETDGPSDGSGLDNGRRSVPCRGLPRPGDPPGRHRSMKREAATGQ